MHLCAGIRGTFAVVLTNPDATVFGQVISITIVGAFVFAVSFAIWSILKATVGIRVDGEAEVNGLDMTEPGIKAYAEFVTG